MGCLVIIRLELPVTLFDPGVSCCLKGRVDFAVIDLNEAMCLPKRTLRDYKA